MSDDSEEEFEFGDEVPKPTKRETEKLTSLADKIPSRKIPKKRALPPQAEDDLSEGEIEPASESDYEARDDDGSDAKDHTLRKKDKLEGDDFEVSLSSLIKKSSTKSKTSGSTVKKKKTSKSEEKTPKKKSSSSKVRTSKTPTKKNKKHIQVIFH